MSTNTEHNNTFFRYVPSEDLANIITEYYGEERVKDYVIFDCATELQVLRIIENNLGLILYPRYSTRSTIFLGNILFECMFIFVFYLMYFGVL